MCIRDSPLAVQKLGPAASFPYFVGRAVVAKTPAEKKEAFAAEDFDPADAAVVDRPAVSYTHLTLPTIYSV